MDYEQKINSIQWEALIEAIGNGGGGAGGPGAWQKVASNITEIPWASLNCDEILCIVKQTIGQKPAAAFILPYSAMGENVPIVDGNYYNANYYYSFGIQSGNTNLYVNPSWCRGYESGTVISGSNFVMDVYVRKGASGGGSGGNTKMKSTTWGTDLIVDDNESLQIMLMYGSNFYTIWVPSTDEVHVRDLYIYNEYTGTGSVSFNDRVLNIPITITRPTGTNNIAIHSDSNMSMSAWYS